MIWTLRKKIFIGCSIVLTLIIVVFVLAFANLLSLGRGILKGNYMSMICADNMSAAIERQNDATSLIILGYTDEGLKQFEVNKKQFMQWLDQEKNYITEIGENDAVRDIEAQYSLYLSQFSMLKTLYQIDSQKSTKYYHETMLPSFQSIRNASTNLREINKNALFKIINLAQFITAKVIWFMILTGIISIGIGLGLSFLLSNLLVKHLRQIVKAVQKVADGNYDIEVPVNSSDELGYLAGEFNEMIGKLKELRFIDIKRILLEKQKNDAIIKNIDDGLLVTNSELKIINMNLAAAMIFDVEIDEIQGKHISKVVKSDLLLDHINHLVRLEQPDPIENGKNIITIMQGDTLHYYMFSITPIYTDDTNNAISDVILLLRDITKLEELDNLKDEFVMTVSHELYTPLTSISMGIEVLQQDATQKLNEKEQQILFVVHDEVEQLKKLVKDP